MVHGLGHVPNFNYKLMKLLAQSSPTTPPPLAAANPGRRTLLIVDDEEGPRQSLRVVFEDQYDVLLAGSGTQALELARHHPVDAAVLDIRMAGLSGIDVLVELKRHDPAIEVVMLTAFQSVETARLALRLGACDYLTKPFDLTAMREAVATAMQRNSLAEQMSLNTRRLRELEEAGLIVTLRRGGIHRGASVYRVKVAPVAKRK